MKKNYIEIKNESLVFAFDNLGEDEKFTINFNRTLRIPDDNKKYSLPPGLGHFPLAHTEDYASKVPSQWNEHGGIFFPMYQAEAMWMGFRSSTGRPFAVKIASGKVNAVSGEQWTNTLNGKTKSDDNFRRINKDQNSQKPDYLVCPSQPWLDGFNVGKGVIRQFVAVPLDSGYTVEEQVTGKAEHGGIQIMVYPMKESEWQKIKPVLRERERGFGGGFVGAMSSDSFPQAKAMRSLVASSAAKPDMGMGAGGMMTQEIYEDKYGVDVWDAENSLRIFVHLANSEQYLAITGKNPPTKPFTKEHYASYNYPWFEYYSQEIALDGSSILSKVDSIASMQEKKNETILPDDGMKPKYPPIMLGKKVVKDGEKW